MPDERLSRSRRSLSRSHLDRDAASATPTDDDDDTGYLRASVAGGALIRFLTTGMGEGLRGNEIRKVVAQMKLSARNEF